MTEKLLWFSHILTHTCTAQIVIPVDNPLMGQFSQSHSCALAQVSMYFQTLHLSLSKLKEVLLCCCCTISGLGFSIHFIYRMHFVLRAPTSIRGADTLCCAVAVAGMAVGHGLSHRHFQPRVADTAMWVPDLCVHDIFTMFESTKRLLLTVKV